MLLTKHMSIRALPTEIVDRCI